MSLFASLQCFLKQVLSRPKPQPMMPAYGSGGFTFSLTSHTLPHLLIGQSKRENGDCRLYSIIFPAVQHVNGARRLERAAGIEAP